MVDISPLISVNPVISAGAFIALNASGKERALWYCGWVECGLMFNPLAIQCSDGKSMNISVLNR